jgi:ATP-dependent DNA helicase RecG
MSPSRTPSRIASRTPSRTPDPFWKSDEKLGVTATFAAGEATGEVTGEVRRLIGAIVSEMTRQEMQNALELKHEDHFRKAYLLPALEANLIEMTIPGKPKSSKQRYRLTSLGKTIRARSIGSDS